VPAVLLLIASAEPTAGDSPASAKLQIAQAEFSRGDFQGALNTLDSAATQASDEKLLAKIHLLRGQCFAAAQNFVAADAAFAKALEHDPEASLDAGKVDPTVVSMVESLRTQMRGDLRIQTDPRGATVSIDGRPAGISPLTVPVSIGRHVVEAKSPDGKLSWREEVVVRVKKTTTAKLTLREGGKEGRRWSEQSKPTADLRLLLQPTAGNFFGIEIGGGFEHQFLRLTLHASLYPNFGLTPRVALAAPVADRTDIYLSFEIPTIFASPTLFGLGGSGGVEYKLSRWLGVFVEVGVRHFFTGGITSSPNRLTVQPGLRLRIP
jgi:hypothetical protein